MLNEKGSESEREREIGRGGGTAARKRLLEKSFTIYANVSNAPNRKG